MNTNILHDLSTAAFALSAHVANGGPHAECHAFTAAWLADQIIAERTRELAAQDGAL